MILLTVSTRGELRAVGEGPRAREITAVAFVELEAVNAEVNERFSLVIGEDFASFGGRKVRNNAAPDEVIAGIRRDVIVDRAVRMGECVLPEVDVESAFLQVVDESLRIRVS